MEKSEYWRRNYCFSFVAEVIKSPWAQVTEMLVHLDTLFIPNQIFPHET